jgi:cell division protease FtsH
MASLASSASSKTPTILERTAPVSDLSPTQNKVDSLVSNSIEQASDPKVLAAMMGAGMAGRITRLGVFTTASSLIPEGNAVTSILVRGSGTILGLAGESAAFTGINRGFLLVDGKLPTQNFGNEWLNSAISIGSLKFFGKLGEGQNPLLQHLMADAGMVSAHSFASLLHLEEKPEGDLFSRFVEAETLNWQMKAGMGLLHTFSPQLAALEQSMDLSLKSQEGRLESRIRSRLFLASENADRLKEDRREQDVSLDESPENSARRRGDLSWLGLSLGLAAFFTPESAFAADGSSGGGTSFSTLFMQAAIAGFFIWGLTKGVSYVKERYLGGGKANSEATKFGKIEARLYEGNRLGITFRDVAGADEAKEDLKEISDYLKDPTRFVAMGARIPKGVLLKGPPGTGKTLFAKAIAGEAKVPFFSISGSEFVEMFVGVGASRIRDLFKQGKKKAPCIIFIDELDAIGRARGAGAGTVTSHQETEQTLNQLLVEMDGFDSGNDGVVIIAATNRPEILDAALLRPGRFDRHITVPRPDLKGRMEILDVHMRKLKIAQDANVQLLAQRTPGFVGADLAKVVNEAALLAVRRGKNEISMSEFESALDKVLMGAEMKGKLISPEEKKRTAIHEAGHTVPAMLLEHSDPVHKVSIIPREIGALGVTLQLPGEDRNYALPSQLKTKLAVLLGGRMAEELILGEGSTGAKNDLEKATEIAEEMVKSWGMSEKLGLVTFNKSRSAFLETAGVASKSYSEKTAQEIDAEIHRLIQEAADQVKKLLTENRPLLEAISGRLLQIETVEKDELDRIFAAHQPRQRAVAR